MHAFALSPDDGSGYQSSFKMAVDGRCAGLLIGTNDLRGCEKRPKRFIDLRAPPANANAATLAQQLALRRLHVLVDLNGYTTEERADALAYKSAPVRLHAIGYPGSMGAEFMPYMLLDRHASPPLVTPRGSPPSAVGLSERLVLLPHCYQSNDHARSTPDPVSYTHLTLPTIPLV